MTNIVGRSLSSGEFRKPVRKKSLHLYFSTNLQLKLIHGFLYMRVKIVRPYKKIIAYAR